MPTPREAYTNTVGREGFSGARVANVDVSSGAEAISRAAQGFGNDLASAAKDVQKAEERDAETAAREADNIRTAKRLKRMYEGPEGFFNKEGRNALEDQPQLEKDLATIDQESESLLSGKPLAQRMFRDLTVRRNTDDLPRIYQHTSKQRDVYETAVDEAAFDNAVDLAATSKDPATIDTNFATIVSIAERQAIRKGIADPNTEEGRAALTQVRQSAYGKGVAAVAETLERDSADNAIQFVTLHAHKMDPQDVAKLLKGLEGGAAEERAETKIADYEVPKGGYAPTSTAAAVAEGTVDETQPTVATIHPTDAALDAAQFTGPGAQEGAAAHTNRDGSLIKSPKGAAGVTQVMFKTGFDPGYGVKPLQNNSREEYLRFGRDYRKAMLKEYGGNIVLALTAYNWGPGNLNAHLKKVGDPRDGKISDAAFIATLPNKEAREYAEHTLNRAGVTVAGVARRSSAQAAAPAVGMETDIAATVNNIMADPNITWTEKKALIAVANRRHSYGQQAKSETEARLKDEAYQAINAMPVNGFTDFNKLPLSLRNRMSAHPELYNSMRNMADTNREQVEAKYDAEKKKTFDDKLAALENDLQALAWTNPAAFQKIDFYGSPKWAKMGTDKVAYWMKQQQASIDSGNGKGADHGAIRTEVNRYTSKDVKKDPKKMGLINQTVITLEEKMLNDPARKGKPLSQTERQALVLQATTEATYTVNGKTYTGTRAEAAAAGARVSQVDIYAHARAELQRRWGRVPLPAEVEAAVQQFRRAQGDQ